jgi:hypothetical protein
MQRDQRCEYIDDVVDFIRRGSAGEAETQVCLSNVATAMGVLEYILVRVLY